VTYKVLAFLDPGINLTVFGTWFLSATGPTKSFSYTVNNTDGLDYLLRFHGEANVPPEERFWTPCGDVGTFTMNLRTRLESANATGSGQIFGDDSSAPGLILQVGLDWRQCNESLT
jgi:hypothetical protein